MPDLVNGLCGASWSALPEQRWYWSLAMKVVPLEILYTNPLPILILNPVTVSIWALSHLSFATFPRLTLLQF